MSIVPRTTNNGGNFFGENVQIGGRLCVGDACTDGESPGLGTIRIDSDNTWIAFNDASTLAGFPTNGSRTWPRSATPPGTSA